MTPSLLLSACTLALGAALPVQDDGAPAPETSRPRKHLLHLASGGVLRVTARQTADGFEIRRGREWVAIPASAVTRAVLERDVLAESRKLAAALRRDDHERRVEYARWLAEAGLYSESLGAVDRVLDAFPDHPAALAFLAERPVKLALPPVVEGDRSAFYVEASRFDLAARELAVLALGDVADGEAVRSELASELSALTSARRTFAALALRRLFPGAETTPLLRRAVLDPVAGVRAEASAALRDAANPELAGPVIGALGSSHPLVRRYAAEALGEMGYAVAVEPLVAALQSGSGYRPAASHIFVGSQHALVFDFDPEVAQGEAIADPQINVLTQGAVLDARVVSTNTSSVAAERTAVRGALERLTGARVSRSRDAWQDWWDEHGADFRRENGLVPPGTDG